MGRSLAPAMLRSNAEPNTSDCGRHGARGWVRRRAGPEQMLCHCCVTFEF